MSQLTDAQLITQAQEIRDETNAEGNTALRVYNMLLNMIDSKINNDDDLDYWPLGGAATLTDNFALDGDGNDLDFTNLGSFSVASIGAIGLNSNDGVDESYLTLDPDSLNVSIATQMFVSAGLMNFQSAGDITFTSDDGVDSSSLSLGPDSFTLELGTIGVDNAFALWATGASSSISCFDPSSEGYSLIFEPDRLYLVDVRATTRGIEYDSDYSSGFTSRSLVDKAYVDALFSGGAGSALGLVSYTVAGVPSASPAGKLIYVSNESGGPQPAFSDGTDWRRITDGNIIAA